jgi:hypothetical protein
MISILNLHCHGENVLLSDKVKFLSLSLSLYIYIYMYIYESIFSDCMEGCIYMIGCKITKSNMNKFPYK